MNSVRVPAWLLPFLIGASAAVVVAGALDRMFAPGFGGLWLTLTILLGGVVIHLRANMAPVCDMAPRLQPLQVSGLAALALGVQCVHAAEQPALMTMLPALQLPWLPYALIAGGLLTLAWRSLSATCRDDALREPSGRSPQ